MESIEEYFKSVSAEIDAELDRLIPGGPPARLYEAVRWSVFAGGKRFRPSLLCAAGEVFGAERGRLFRSAVAIEMVHTYSLIHDDLPAMDDDSLRRGRATCHVKFDEATAILAGDVLQSLAFGVVVGDTALDAETRTRVLAEISEASVRMVDGQQLDLDAEGKPTTIDDLQEIHRNKTGAMIVASARCGAIIGGASEGELASVTAYASALGLLFQITDDILDVTETTENLGKTAGKDLAAEKATYPAFHGLEKSRELALAVHREAVAEVGNIGRPAPLLVQIADFILSRRS